jgi:hypothetical protein
MYFGIGKPEILMRDKTVVTGIVVTWARSLARRANT